MSAGSRTTFRPDWQKTYWRRSGTLLTLSPFAVSDTVVDPPAVLVEALADRYRIVRCSTRTLYNLSAHTFNWSSQMSGAAPDCRTISVPTRDDPARDALFQNLLDNSP